MLFFIYELIQTLIFKIVFVLNKFIVSKKFNRFCELRMQNEFESNVEKACFKFKSSKENIKHVYWFHVASAGEMEQAIPVARALYKNLSAQFFLTYYSPSAEKFVNNFPGLIGSSGLPLDLQRNYKCLLQKMPIEKIFFVRYDIWPSLLRICEKNKIQINLISATMNKTKNGFVKNISQVFSSYYYRKFTHIFAVNKSDVEYFSKYIPKKNVFYAGDPKWSRALERATESLKRKEDFHFNLFYKYCMSKKTVLSVKSIIFGSPHKEEHEIALECSVIKEKLFTIYVPHEVEEKKCNELVNEFNKIGFSAILYSNFIKELEINSNENSLNEFSLDTAQKFKLIHEKPDSSFSVQILNKYNFIIFDKIGYLADLYEACDLSIIGGGFDGQIHNVLESAAHGVPVMIGNLYMRADEAKELVEVGAALSFQNPRELFQFLIAWVSLKEQGTDSISPIWRLAEIKSKSLELFRNIPDTSEIILRALKKESC